MAHQPPPHALPPGPGPGRSFSWSSILQVADATNRLGGPLDVPVKVWRDGQSSAPATGYRFWGITGHGELAAPYEPYSSTLVAGLDFRAGPCRRGCIESPGACGSCGMTVVFKPEHLNTLHGMFVGHPSWSGRVVAARVSITPPVHWTSSFIPRRPAETIAPHDAKTHIAIWAHPEVAEARAAAVRIEAMQVPSEFAHLAAKLTARHGLPVAISDDFTQLAPAGTPQPESTR